MKKWTRSIEIQAPIEQVWKLFNGSLEDMQKVMPQVIENEPIIITEGGIGSVYRQKFKEGKRVQEYEVKTLDYLDTPDHKILKVGFSLANMFEITAAYELRKLDEQKTWFQYSTTNQPFKWYMKLLLSLLFGNNKIVVKFVERVKRVAESDS
jgi:hypothetical protein